MKIGFNSDNQILSIKKNGVRAEVDMFQWYGIDEYRTTQNVVSFFKIWNIEILTNEQQRIFTAIRKFGSSANMDPYSHI